MRRALILATFALALTGLLTPMTASAQEDTSGSERASDGQEVVQLFDWYTAADPDWGRGALFAGLGLLGAIVVTFGLIGGAVPGTAGKTKIDADEARLERLATRLEEVANATPVDAEAVTALNTAVDQLRDDTRSERWRQYTLASILYAAIGASFATALATDLVQALVIGAGWTGIVGSLGLQTDFEQRKTIKDEALKDLLAKLKLQDTPPQEVESASQKTFRALAL